MVLRVQLPSRRVEAELQVLSCRLALLRGAVEPGSGAEDVCRSLAAAEDAAFEFEQLAAKTHMRGEPGSAYFPAAATEVRSQLLSIEALLEAAARNTTALVGNAGGAGGNGGGRPSFQERKWRLGQNCTAGAEAPGALDFRLLPPPSEVPAASPAWRARQKPEFRPFASQGEESGAWSPGRKEWSVAEAVASPASRLAQRKTSGLPAGYPAPSDRAAGGMPVWESYGPPPSSAATSFRRPSSPAASPAVPRTAPRPRSTTRPPVRRRREAAFRALFAALRQNGGPRFVSSPELAAVPEATRGKATLERVNAALADVHHFLTLKYGLLGSGAEFSPGGGTSAAALAHLRQALERAELLPGNLPHFSAAELRLLPQKSIPPNHAGADILNTLKFCRRLRQFQANKLKHYEYVLPERHEGHLAAGASSRYLNENTLNAAVGPNAARRLRRDGSGGSLYSSR